MTVKETKGKIIFLHKLSKGGSEHSFGIHVAQLAAMPGSVVKRASEILQHLAQDKTRSEKQEQLKNIPTSNYQLALFEADPAFAKLQAFISQIALDTLSPEEALRKLGELKAMLNKTR